jgi:hypothetical protein
MSIQFQFSYQCPPMILLPNAADAAGRSTSVYKFIGYISGKLYIECRVNQGNAATVQFTPMQAQSSAGLNAKAIPAVPIFFNGDTSLSDTLVAQTAAANFTTDAATKDKVVVFEFNPVELDMVNGFDHIGVTTGASNAANITSALCRGIMRYQQAAPPASEI